MNRREALQKTALALGYTLTGPAIVGIMKGCKAAPDLNYVPQFFTKEQAVLVAELAEIIIPKTTTPGAKDAGVPAFIDSLIKETYPLEDQERFVKGLTDFDAAAQQAYGDSFVSCSKENQLSLVKKIHDEVISGGGGNVSFGWWRKGGGEGKPFIVEMKELTLLGFFISEAGATQVLQYKQTPGPYKGCVPLTEVGKAWAT